MTNTTKVTVITTIAVLAVIGVVALFASPSADRDRAWVEQFPAFTQLPEDDWELLDDNVTATTS